MPRANGTRVHQEDLCQSLGIHPATKYQNEGGPSPAVIAAMFRRSMTFVAATDAVARFVDGLIYNWLIGGTDAHEKNYSILLDGSDTMLAPLYDLASALPYDDIHFPKAKLAMKIGRHYTIGAVDLASWTELANDVGVDASLVIDCARQLASEVPDAIHAAVADTTVAGIGSDLPAVLAARVEKHAAKCLRRLN